MSKKQRERKLARLEERTMEKQAVEERRRRRLAPVIRTVRQVALTLFLTVLVLYIGFFINGHLPGVVSRLTRAGI